MPETDPNRVTLRDAVAADASSLAALSIEVWVGTYLRRGVNGFFADYVLETFTAENMRAQIVATDSFTIVSENQDGIDGFIRVRQDALVPVEGCSETEITTFYVQPRHHGRGVGKALLGAAVQRCRADGVGSVWLTTNAENTPAIGFYLRYGFAQVGQTAFVIGEQGYLNNVYRLDLGESAV